MGSDHEQIGVLLTHQAGKTTIRPVVRHRGPKPPSSELPPRRFRSQRRSVGPWRSESLARSASQGRGCLGRHLDRQQHEPRRDCGRNGGPTRLPTRAASVASARGIDSNDDRATHGTPQLSSVGAPMLTPRGRQAPCALACTRAVHLSPSVCSARDFFGAPPRGLHGGGAVFTFGGRSVGAFAFGLELRAVVRQALRRGMPSECRWGANRCSYP